MLTVLPIQDKNIQKELCELCNIGFNAESFAYRADDGVFLGVCQFRFDNDTGIINGFKYAPGTQDDEAMIIMLRATMNFMHRCGLKSSIIYPDATCENLLALSGYSRQENGTYFIDLDKFYISPCHYNK